MMGTDQSKFQPKKNPISDDYRITSTVLGLGINGKVLQCYSKSTGEKFALKVRPYAVITIYNSYFTHVPVYFTHKGT